MQIGVHGTGYLGAVHAACMARLGHDVMALDVEAEKIRKLACGEAPFFEPGFTELLNEGLESGKLKFTNDVDDVVNHSDVHFICVGTPQIEGGNAADVRFVDAAVDVIIERAAKKTLIVGKSTVPVGTAERLAARVAHASKGDAGSRISLAWNPEFLREGTAVADTLQPDRIVFGIADDHSEDLLREVYESVIAAGTPVVVTDLPTSEMVKVAANAFLATKISFINAMAELCEAAHADVVTLATALGYDERIGSKFLSAGLGFGGGCLPKDIRAFSARAGELGAADTLTFLQEVDKINMRRRERAVAVAASMLGGNFLGRTVSVLGAAFKPNSDDVRDSPALTVAASIHLKGAKVRVHDPQSIDNAKKLFPTLSYSDSVQTACKQSDLIILATEWDEYRGLDPGTVRDWVAEPNLLDARNALDHRRWAAAGWQVRALGRGNRHV